MTDYVPPKVWKWEQPSGGQFANINRPIAGSTHDKELPVGKHPFQLYSLATPNGQKVSIMFEELLARGHKDAEYDAWPIRIGDRDQFGSGFVDINPNSKIPALVDRSGPQPIRIFESGAILLHLADIAIWPWYGGVALGRSYEGADVFLATHEYEHLMRWAKQIAERPAVKRGRIVNKLSGDESEQLHERHDESDFDLRTEDKVKGL